jgi:hypothetical protein
LTAICDITVCSSPTFREHSDNAVNKYRFRIRLQRLHFSAMENGKYHRILKYSGKIRKPHPLIHRRRGNSIEQDLTALAGRTGPQSNYDQRRLSRSR